MGAGHGARMSAVSRQPARCDTTMQACDTVGVSATTRRDTTLGGCHDTAMCTRLGAPVCPRCAQLGQFGCFVHLTQFLIQF